MHVLAAGVRPQPALRAAAGSGGGRRAEAQLVAAPRRAVLQARGERSDAARPLAWLARSHSSAAAGAACPVGPLLRVEQQLARRRRQEGLRVAAATAGHEPEGYEDERGSIGTEAAGGGRGVASGLELAAAAPGAAAPASSPATEPTLRDIYDAIMDMEARMTGMEAELLEELSALGEEIEAVTDVQRAMAEGFARLHRHIAGADEQLRRPQLLTSVDDLLHICSWFNSPARKEQLLRALLDKRHSAYLCLRGLVLQQLQDEADKQGVQLPCFPEQVDCWKAERERWQQARKALPGEAKQQGSGKTALLPFLKGLHSYTSGAAHRRLPSHLHNPKRGKLVLMLLAAQAANRLLDALELDAMSVLEQRSTEEGTALVLDLVVQTHPAGIQKAVEQLAVRARILVYVLATTNAQLLKALGPLKVVGTVEVVGGPLPSEQQRFWAGQQRDVSCSAAPETAGLTIQLWLRPLACVPARRGGWLARPAPFS